MSTSARRTGALLLLFLLAVNAYFFPRWADWNQNSRFDLVTALVDHHTMQIDQYVTNTGDYAEFDGHFYSDKAPGLALLGVPVYAAFRQLVPPSFVESHLGTAAGTDALVTTLRSDGTGLTVDKLYMFVALAFTTFVTVAVPSAVLGLLLFLVAGALGWTLSQRLVATLAFALGTNAFAYANAFVGHQTVAFLLFAAFALLMAIRLGRLSRRWLYLAGFLLAYAIITEFPTALIAAVIGLYAMFSMKDGVNTSVRMIVGGLPAVLLLVGHDLAAFGTPLPIGYLHSALWSDVHDIGFVSLTYPHMDALWGITFGVYRGLFFLSPFLLFAIPGYNALWQDRTRRPEFWVLLFVPVVFLLFNSSSAMWQGGFAVGPRYLVASLPFLALAAGAGLRASWQHLTLRPIVVLSLIWSIFAVWAESIAGQAFPDFTPNPLFDFSLPLLAHGDIARNAGMLFKVSGWLSLGPLVAMALACMALNRLPRRNGPRSGPAPTDRAGSPAAASVR